MNALEASQRKDWLDDAAHGMMNVHLDDFVAGARACIGYCYGYGGLVLRRDLFAIDGGLAETEVRVAKAEAEWVERRVVVEYVAAAGCGGFVVVHRKLADVARDCDGEMA